jgi:hypothetical protein
VAIENGESASPDFGDPTYEPTDDDLRALSREAFEGVSERRCAALAQLEAEVRALRAAVLDRARSAPTSTGTVG